MKKPRVLKSWSKRNLPADIWAEILSRLPVKSLLRFRCVSKSWRSMIDDPDFCRLHLHNFNNNVNETHLFLAEESKIKYYNINCVLRSSRTFRRLGRFNTPLLDYANWSVVSFVDGLFMLQYDDGGDDDDDDDDDDDTLTKKLVLWNPSIQRFRALPQTPTVPGATIILDLGFGFDPSIKDYKHVRLFLQDAYTLHSIAVYIVGTGTWRTTEFCGEVIYDWDSTSNFTLSRVQNVCYRGILYFIATKQNGVDEELVSFDLSREVFASTDLPTKDDIGQGGKFHLIDGCGSLGLAYSLPTKERVTIRVWILQSCGASIDSMSWTRHDYYDCPNSDSSRGVRPRLFCLRKNRDLLLRRKTGEWVLCGFEAPEGKILQKYTRGRYARTIRDYLESLLLRDGCDSSNPKNKIGKRY